MVPMSMAGVNNLDEQFACICITFKFLPQKTASSTHYIDSYDTHMVQQAHKQICFKTWSAILSNSSKESSDHPGSACL